MKALTIATLFVASVLLIGGVAETASPAYAYGSSTGPLSFLDIFSGFAWWGAE